MPLDYPTEFPQPQVEGYGVSSDSGLIRTPFQSGRARQRRIYDSQPSIVTLNFTMTTQEYGVWNDWMNENGFTWFIMQLTSAHSFSQDNPMQGNVSPHRVRCVSNIQAQHLGSEAWAVSIQVETSRVDDGGTDFERFYWASNDVDFYSTDDDSVFYDTRAHSVAKP